MILNRLNCRLGNRSIAPAFRRSSWARSSWILPQHFRKKAIPTANGLRATAPLGAALWLAPSMADCQIIRARGSERLEAVPGIIHRLIAGRDGAME